MQIKLSKYDQRLNLILLPPPNARKSRLSLSPSLQSANLRNKKYFFGPTHQEKIFLSRRLPWSIPQTFYDS